MTAESEAGVPSGGRGLLSQAGHVMQRILDGDLVLYDPARQRVHALNATAAAVWMACDGQHNEADIVAELLALYPRHASAIATDVRGIVKQFIEEGLLNNDGRATG